MSTIRWAPLCHAMARYCEPYFKALKVWSEYQDSSLFENRLRLLQILSNVLKNSINQKEITYSFDIVSHNNVDLLPEVLPQAGLVFNQNDDILAFKTAQNFINSEEFFQSGGVYFQTSLLKALAGWDDATLQSSNLETRESVIRAIEKLFRISEAGGEAHIVSKEANHLNFEILPQSLEQPLSEAGSKLLKRMIELREKNLVVPDKEVETKSSDCSSDLVVQVIAPPCQEATASLHTDNSKSSKEKKSKKKPDSTKLIKSKISPAKSNEKKPRKRKPVAAISSPQDETNNFEDNARDDDDWITSHPTVGLKIAKYFAPPAVDVPSATKRRKSNNVPPSPPAPVVVNKLFVGEIIKYAPPSQEGLDDQLYHVVYEDGDTEDIDENEMNDCRALYLTDIAEVPSEDQWTEVHESIGQKVAKYFDIFPKDSDSEQTDVAAVGTEEGKGGEGGLVKILFLGTVTRYCPPSSELRDDQLYRVVWEDGDSEEFDATDFANGLSLYKANA